MKRKSKTDNKYGQKKANHPLITTKLLELEIDFVLFNVG